MCGDKEMWTHYLVLVQKIVKLVLLKCNQSWHLTDSTCACVSVYLCIIFFFTVIVVILLCTVKLKQSKGRLDEFCMPCAWLPVSFLLC